MVSHCNEFQIKTGQKKSVKDGKYKNIHNEVSKSEKPDSTQSSWRYLLEKSIFVTNKWNMNNFFVKSFYLAAGQA